MATKDRGTPSTRAGSGAAGRDRGKAAIERGRKADRPVQQPPTSEPMQSGTIGGAKGRPEGIRRGRTRRTGAGEAEHVSVPPAAVEHVETSAPVTDQLESAAAARASERETSPDVAEEVGPAAGEEALEEPAAADARGTRRDRHRTAHANALGLLIERQFADPGSPCHSYSDLERRSGISREALSRYVTSRADRRRSPTIDTLVAIADALHVSLEGVARAAAASVKGITPPPDEVQHVREEALSSLVAGLSDAQFNAVVELLRQLGPWRSGAS